MAKRHKKPPQAPTELTPAAVIPPGATRKALDRRLDPGGGPPGSAAGPRHAADDPDTENESYGRLDTTRTPASPPVDEEDRLEKGPPYAGIAGGAVGGTPAQLRSSEGVTGADADLEPAPPAPAPSAPARIPPELHSQGQTIRLTGFEAIEYAEKQGLTLNKHPDPISGARVGLTGAEAQAIAEDDANLIWLDVAREDYYAGPPTSFEPDH